MTHTLRSNKLGSHAHLLYWAFVIFSTFSIVLAMATTTDKRWMQWHLSRLGEGVELPAAIFNFSLCIIGLLAFLLLKEVAALVKQRFRNQQSWPLVLLGLTLMLQHFGLAAFPYDRFPHIHDFFGYGVFFVSSGMLFFSWLIAPYLQASTKRYSIAIAVIAAIPMILYQYFSVGTLLIMELYGILCMFVWFWLVLYDVENHKHHVDLLQ